MSLGLLEQLHIYGEDFDAGVSPVSVDDVTGARRVFAASPSPPKGWVFGLVAALAAFIVVGAVAWLARVAPVDVTDQPSVTVPAESPTGLPGLPPEGAAASTPERGELVASMWEHIGAPGSFGNGWLYVYADGRLIWERLDPEPTGGWLEQRLTSEGVEVIRSEIIATGLFDPDQPPPEPNTGFPRGVNGGFVQVRSGDRLVYVNRVVPDLFERLAELWVWLPDSAWEDTMPRPYVPSRYAVCVHSGGYVAPTDVSEHLAELPAAAQDLLAGAPRLHMASLADVDPAAFAGAAESAEYCFDITTEEARTLAMALTEAGVEELPHRPEDGSEVWYVVSRGLDENFTGTGFDGVTVALWPMLPHGVPAFTGA